EKSKIENECAIFQLVSNIYILTQSIQELNDRIERMALLGELCENSFMKFQFRHNQALEDLPRSLNINIWDLYEKLSEYNLYDKQNGLYTMIFRPLISGNHQIGIHIFDRPISGSPFIVDVTKLNNLVWSFATETLVQSTSTALPYRSLLTWEPPK
ncbi:unnamed protein product, partial [Didymodactylos carnosus]